MKTTKTIAILAALTATFVYSNATAATRIWTDTQGKSIEAEQVRVLNDQVVLRLIDGREIKVSFDALSEADRKQAMLAQPPTLELKVSAKTSRSNKSLGVHGRRSAVQLEEESTQVVVAVSKSSSAPYELPLNAVLYVMGEWGGGQHEVIDKVSSTFTYTERGQVFELASDKFESVKREGGERRTEYKGWIVVVFDSNGNPVATKSSKKEYEKNVETLLTSDKGAALNGNYESIEAKTSPGLKWNRRI